MNPHFPQFLRQVGAELVAIFAFAAAVVLFWLLVMGGAVLLFGPPHTG